MPVILKRLFNDWFIALTDDFELIDNGNSAQWHFGELVIYASSKNLHSAGKALPAKAGIEIAHQLFAKQAENSTITSKLDRLNPMEQWSIYRVIQNPDGFVMNGVKAVEGKIVTVTISFRDPADEDWAKRAFSSITYVSRVIPAN